MKTPLENLKYKKQLSGSFLFLFEYLLSLKWSIKNNDLFVYFVLCYFLNKY